MIQLRQLEDKCFIQEFELENKYYLETLFKKLKNFLTHLPVPYSIDFDKEKNIFIFRIGDNKKVFEINQNIYYTDFITMIKKWVIQFYPQYYIDGEYGIILKIFFKTNEFLFFNNGTKEIRYAGKRNFLLSLSDFLKKIRHIEDKTELKTFILENSTLIETIDSKTQEVYIGYGCQMMKNFFIINFEELKNYPVKKIGEDYKIGKYNIRFCDKLSEIECIEYFLNRKNN
jgi:hypothetical protein